MRILNAFDRATFTATMLDNSRRMRGSCKDSALGYALVARTVRQLPPNPARPEAVHAVRMALIALCHRLDTREHAVRTFRVRCAVNHALSVVV